MQWRGVTRVGGAAQSVRHTICLVLSAALAGSLGACSSSTQFARTSLASAKPGSTITFESIDGPPPEVFNKLVASLNDEATARKIAVVSRNSPATYRVRGYVSALVERGGKTSFTWVWDVYDADKRRTLRLSGEEPAGSTSQRNARSASTAWVAADDQLLRRMAQNGMAQMEGFLNSSDPLPAAVPAAEPSLLTLVSGRDDSPEAAGILRRLGGAADPEPVAETPPPEPPKIAPKSGKTRSAAVSSSTDGSSTRP